MKNPSLEKEKIIQDMKNLFRLKKKIKEIEDKLLRDIKNIFDVQCCTSKST